MKIQHKELKRLGWERYFVLCCDVLMKLHYSIMLQKDGSLLPCYGFICLKIEKQNHSIGIVTNPCRM